MTPGLKRILCLILPAVLFAGMAHATLYWQTDTNRGISVFAGLNLAPGTVSVAPDPLGQYGNVYKFFLPDTNSSFGKERCESSGTETPTGEFRPAYNTDYYIGWRAMWSPMPVNPGWVALMQMHGYGVSGQGAPLVFRCVNNDGYLWMQNNANGIDVDFLHMPFKTNVWQTFVIHTFLSTNWSQGYVEIWYNGVLQTNINGTTRWYGPTWDNVDGVWSDSYNKFKWGCYRSGAMDGKGLATAYLSNAKVGSTYGDVDPNGAGDFSIAASPPSQVVEPGDGPNYTVTIGALAGFSNNVTLSASGLPDGVSAGFNPVTVTNSGNSTMTLSTSPTTPIGSYRISVVGTGAGLAHSNTVLLVVSGFSLAAAPPSQTVNAGYGTNFTVTVTTNSSFTGSVALGVSGLTVGASANFSLPTLTQSGASTLTVNTTSNAASGSYLLTIGATNGSLVLNTTVTLVINGVVANPGSLFWTAGGADANWSTILNWTNNTAGGNGPPTPANSLVFTNYGAVNASAISSPGSGVVVPANINSTVDANFSVVNLTNFANAINTSPNYQNLGIASGATLMVGNNLQVGGYGAYDFGANNVVNMSISGAGATLVVSNGQIAVCQGSGSGGAHDATLDLSGLDNLVMHANQIKMGVENTTRSGGILYLARTNNLTLLSAGYVNTDGSGSPYSGSPALTIGHNKTGVGNGAQLYLGISNTIAADYVTIGRGDYNDSLKFNPAFTNQNPSVYIYGINGITTPVGVYVVGDNSPGAGGVTSSGTNDFTGGTVNALINYLCVGRGRQAAGDITNSVGTLTFNNGSISANALAIGFMYPSGSNSVVNGTVNVNGSGTLTVLTNVTIAARPNSGGTGTVQGTLNVNGGTVTATNIVGGGGTSVINLNSGTMDLKPDWATSPGVITNISSLNIGAYGAVAPALLTDVGQIFTTNVINLGTNGTLSGNPVITAPALYVNGTLSPGNNGAGVVTDNGSVAFEPGGTFVVTVDDATAGPGAGWSFLQISGGLELIGQAPPTSLITIEVLTADNPAANFNSASNYDWVIATANGGILGFGTNLFTINTNFFANALGAGSFYLHTIGNSLVLSFTNNLPPALPPVAINFTASGNNYVFSGTNGLTGRNFYVLASTNLALPLTNWTVIMTNSFDTNGDFNFTNPPDPDAPQTFYLLQLQ